VHQFRGTDNGINWARLDAEGATDAKLFINDRDLKRLMRAAIRIECNNGSLE
jgi:hypothetical protein